MENKKAVAVENAAEDTIDLLEIFRALYRRWVWIVFVALVFGIALGMYGKFVRQRHQCALLIAIKKYL